MTNAPAFSHVRLAAHKKRADLTFRQIAASLGVTERTVQNWCAGDKEPGGTNLVRLAGVLGVEPLELCDAPTEPKAAA